MLFLYTAFTFSKLLLNVFTLLSRKRHLNDDNIKTVRILFSLKRNHQQNSGFYRRFAHVHILFLKLFKFSSKPNTELNLWFVICDSDTAMEIHSKSKITNYLDALISAEDLLRCFVFSFISMYTRGDILSDLAWVNMAEEEDWLSGIDQSYRKFTS